jgi:hypothetical protein
MVLLREMLDCDHVRDHDLFQEVQVRLIIPLVLCLKLLKLLAEDGYQGYVHIYGIGENLFIDICCNIHSDCFFKEGCKDFNDLFIASEICFSFRGSD